MKPNFIGYLLIVALIVSIGLWGFGIYDVYQTVQEGNRLIPLCDVAGGKLIKTYGDQWVCVKSLKLEK